MMPPIPSVSPIVCFRPYFLGISKSSYGAGLIAAYLNGIYNEVSVTQRFFLVSPPR